MLRLSFGTSSNHMKKIANFLGCSGGRKWVFSDYTKYMSEKGRALEQLYKSGTFEFDIEKKTQKENRPVVSANVEELHQAVIGRNSIGNHQIKMMVDGGQGFFKICLSIWLESYSSADNYIN